MARLSTDGEELACPKRVNRIVSKKDGRGRRCGRGLLYGRAPRVGPGRAKLHGEAEVPHLGASVSACRFAVLYFINKLNYYF